MSKDFTFYKIDLYDEVFHLQESMGNIIARLEFMGINNITHERLRQSFQEHVGHHGLDFDSEEFYKKYFPHVVWVTAEVKGIFRNKKLLEKIEADIGCKCFINKIKPDFSYGNNGDYFDYVDYVDEEEKYSLEIHCDNEEQSAMFAFYAEEYKKVLQQ